MKICALMFSLLPVVACVGQAEPEAELDSQQEELFELPSNKLCLIVAHPSESMGDDVLTYRFDPAERCPLVDVTVTDAPSERTDAVTVVIHADASKKNGGKYASYFARTSYTITGKRSIFLPSGRFGGRWVEVTDTLAQGSTDQLVTYKTVDDEAYDSITVAVKVDEMFTLCRPILRPTSDGGWIDTGKVECAEPKSVGKLAATVDIVPEYPEP